MVFNLSTSGKFKFKRYLVIILTVTAFVFSASVLYFVSQDHLMISVTSRLANQEMKRGTALGFQKARKLFNKILKADQDHYLVVTSLLYLDLLSSYRGFYQSDLREQEKLFIVAEKRKMDTPLFTAAKAMRIALNGEHDKAVELLTSAITKEPQSFHLQIALGEIYIKQGKYREARQHLKQTWHNNRNNLEVLLLLADLSLKHMEVDRARKYYHFILNQNPFFPEAILGILFLDLLSDYQQPVLNKEISKNLTKIDPAQLTVSQQIDLLVFKNMAKWLAGEEVDLAEMAEIISQKNDKNTHFNNIGYFLFQAYRMREQSRFNQAVDYLKKSALLQPDNLLLKKIMARFIIEQEKNRRRGKSESHFYNSDYQRHKNAVISIAKEIKNKGQDSFYSQLTYATLMRDIGDKDEAVRTFIYMGEYFPGQPQIDLEVGIMYYQEKRYTDAIKVLIKYVGDEIQEDKKYKRAKAMLLVGNCYGKRKKWHLAKKQYLKAMKIAPGYARIYFDLARYNQNILLNWQRAVHFYSKYLEISPRGSMAAIARREIAVLKEKPVFRYR